MPLVAPEIAVALTVALVFAARYAIEGRQKRQVKNAFSRYLSPVVIEELLRHPELLRLGGERRVLSIFFSDLQGFTTLSEKMEPETLTAFLNFYLSAMTEIIQDEGGTIDKYEGDAIIAFWNAPLEYPDHAMRAVRAALRCQTELQRLMPDFRRWTEGELVMRIGVNSGPAVVGNMGSRTRFDYTMLGDAVNLAARLEGVNKQFGTRVLISEATKGALGGATATREVARVKVVGRAQPVSVYEPLTDEQLEARRDDLATFDKALSHYYRGRFSDALELLRGLADRDPAARAYLARCEPLAANPPEQWDGVWVASEKG
jgi:adenylate cyclase